MTIEEMNKVSKYRCDVNFLIGQIIGSIEYNDCETACNRIERAIKEFESKQKNTFNTLPIE